MKFLIKYGKGRPQGETEIIEAKDYYEAKKKAANNAHGWGFEIKPMKDSKLVYDKAIKNMDKSYLVEYTDTNNKKQKKIFSSEKEAYKFTEELDKRIKNGTCLGYNMTEF